MESKSQYWYERVPPPGAKTVWVSFEAPPNRTQPGGLFHLVLCTTTICLHSDEKVQLRRAKRLEAALEWWDGPMSKSTALCFALKGEEPDEV